MRTSMNSRIVYYIAYGIGVSMLELLLMNFIPLAGSIDLLFISVLVLMVEHKPVPAVFVGGVGSLLHDILSITMFGSHLIIFFLIYLLMLILSERVFTSKAFIAYVVFGILMFALNLGGYHLLGAVTATPHSFSSFFTMFPSYWLSLFINSMIIMVIVYVRLNAPSKLRGKWITRAI